MIQKQKNVYVILRWIAVIPASFLSFYISYMIVKGANYLMMKMYMGSGDDSWVIEYILPLISGATASYFYIICGAYVAPAFKKITGLILLILFTIMCSFEIFLLIWDFRLDLTFQVVGQLAGSITGFTYIKSTFILPENESDF